MNLTPKNTSKNLVSKTSFFWLSLIVKHKKFTVIITFLALYTGSYLINNLNGGYVWELARAKKYTMEGLSRYTACHWQPRYGMKTKFETDLIGNFYSPLIYIDRKFFHPTKHRLDRGFWKWLYQREINEWHPNSKHLFITWKKNEQEKRKAPFKMSIDDFAKCAHLYDNPILLLLKQHLLIYTDPLRKGSEGKTTQEIKQGCITWANKSRMEDESYLFSFKIDDKSFKVVKYFDNFFEEKVFKLAQFEKEKDLRNRRKLKDLKRKEREENK
jgi:hypothetical protein